jgi:hypothetical protein
MEGFLKLSTHSDLFKKLEWEFERLNEDQENSFLAYNFFVTAWHLLEWKYPDPEGKVIRKNLRDQTPIIQICEHLAVGAKHFAPTSSKHQSVAGSGRSGGWMGSWMGGWTGGWLGGGQLVVILDGDAAKNFGQTITIGALAQHVMDFWRRQIDLSNASN